MIILKQPTKYCFVQELKTSWPTKDLMSFLKFLRQFASGCLYYLKSKNKNKKTSTQTNVLHDNFEIAQKHAQFWFEVQFPLNVIDAGTEGILDIKF